MTRSMFGGLRPRPGTLRATMPADKTAPSAPPEEVGLSSLLRFGVKAAIARWAVRQRSGTEAWPRPQDEAMHAWDGRRHFAEDGTLVAVQSGLAVVARLEWLPGRDAHRVWMMLLTPTCSYTLPGPGQLLLRGGGDHWQAGGLALDCIEPLRQWTVRYRGLLTPHDAKGGRHGPTGPDAASADVPVRVDLTFIADAPAFVPGRDDDPDLLARQFGAAEWDARLLRALRRRSLRSYVQVGGVHGSLAIGPQLVAVRAAGLRQHAWGVRDWGASDTAVQCFAAIGPTSNAAERPVLAWVHAAQFPWLALSGGFVQRPAGIVPLRDLGLTQTDDPGHAPSHVSLHIDAAGGAQTFETETMAQLPLEMDGRGHLDVVLARVHAGDASEGWGLLIHQRRTLPRQRDR